MDRVCSVQCNAQNCTMQLAVQCTVFCNNSVCSAVHSVVYSEVCSAVHTVLYSAVCSKVHSVVCRAVHSGVCSAVHFKAKFKVH